MNYYNMKCPNCKEELDVYDVGYQFRGCVDVYADCYHCRNSFIIYIRYGGIWKYDMSEIEPDEKSGWLEKPNGVHKTIYIYKKGKKHE